MKKIFLIFVLFFAVKISVYSQVENSQQNNLAITVPRFYYEILSFASEDSGKTRVDILVQVPFSVVQFLKNGDYYNAEYSVTISIYDADKKKLLTEKIWNEKVETADFNQTLSQSNYNLSIRSFYLEPQKYTIVLQVEDKDSKKNFTVENKYDIRNLSGNLAMSDIVIVKNQSFSKGDSKLYPNVPRNISNQDDGIPIFYEIYSTDSQNVKLNYNIQNKDKDKIYNLDTSFEISAGINQIYYKIDANKPLGIGEYKVTVNLKNQTNKEISSASKEFNARIPGIPYSINDFDEAIEQMVYIASSSEIKNIKKNKTLDEKLQKFFDFWKEKDPNPNTLENEVMNEYYRRVDYANENFSHYVKGWKTDMGMVYIILGPPNNVDRHPFDYDAKPYEIWEYYDLNRSFVFMDYTGFGDYRLITPFYGDLYRFR